LAMVALWPAAVNCRRTGSPTGYFSARLA